MTPSLVAAPAIDLCVHLLLSFHGDRSKQLAPRQQSPFCLPPAAESFNLEGLYSFHLCDKWRSSWIWDSRERLVVDPDLSGNLAEVRVYVSVMGYRIPYFCFLLHSPQFFRLVPVSFLCCTLSVTDV